VTAHIDLATAADAPAIAAVFSAARTDAMPWLPRLHSDEEREPDVLMAWTP